MAKTKRRSGSYIPYWVTTDWKRVDGYYKRVPIDDAVELNKVLAVYHSDKGTGQCWRKNAPAWFRRDMERIKRAIDAAELKRMKCTGDYEEYSFNPRRKDVGWNWW